MSNDGCGNVSIPERVPQLSQVLRAITKEDFMIQSEDSTARKKGKPSVATKVDASSSGRNNAATTDFDSSSSVFNQRNRIDSSRRQNTQSSFNKRRTEHFPAQFERGNHLKPRNETRMRANEESASPWRASFFVSKRTQERIQKAGKNNRENNGNRAIAVLKALLDTPSNQCNEANVVCALTLSAKVFETDRRHSGEFRSLLTRSLDILHDLVKEERLNTRQLCNAVWAIAKHYDRDETLMPPPPQAAALSSDERVGVAEAWSLIDDSDNENQAKKRIDETVNEIARQLTKILVEENESTAATQKSKVGELCMASWAYGVLRPRRRPPGWQLPPQMGRLNGIGNSKPQSSRSSLFLTFEKWSSTEVDENESQQHTEVESLDVTDQLFDAIGNALCATFELSESETIGPTHTVEQKNAESIRTPPHAVEHHVRLASCSWSELANLAWAYASHGHCKSHSSERLLVTLSHEAVRRVNQKEDDQDVNTAFLTRDISQIVWALGTLQCDNFRLADGLVELVNSLLAFYSIHDIDQSDFGALSRPFINWSCPDLVQLAISLAHARIDEPALLRTLFGEARHRLSRGLDITSNDRHQEQRVGAFRAWEVSVLLWAQARLYLTAAQGPIFADFAAEVPRALVKAMKSSRSDLGNIGIGPQEQANVAWSLTVLQEHQSPEAVEVLSNIFREAARCSQNQRMIQLEHAHQLWQALYLLEEESPKAVQDVQPWFRQHLRQKWLVEKAREKRSSARHRSLSQTLHFMGVSHLNEHDEDIDVAIVLKPDASWTYQAATVGVGASGSRRFGAFRDLAMPVKVAVEFDGPNHFAREAPRLFKGDAAHNSNYNNKPPPPRALGHTVLKYRLLKKQGWTVVRVPYYEFDKIPFWASMERQRYLQRLLKTHANIRFSDVDVSQYKAMVPSRESRFD